MIEKAEPVPPFLPNTVQEHSALDELIAMREIMRLILNEIEKATERFDQDDELYDDDDGGQSFSIERP